SSYYSEPILKLHSFPPRRSSDLQGKLRRPGLSSQKSPATTGITRTARRLICSVRCNVIFAFFGSAQAISRLRAKPPAREPEYARNRKSTRLNSSHVKISYAVFCL